MYNPETNTLLRSYRHHPSNIQGFVDDYSFFICGNVEIF